MAPLDIDGATNSAFSPWVIAVSIASRTFKAISFTRTPTPRCNPFTL